MPQSSLPPCTVRPAACAVVAGSKVAASVARSATTSARTDLDGGMETLRGLVDKARLT
ncbi:hypothetical protein GCM10010392_59550 [Streptomyces clavifer]|nr:hypothetical protein GCM10010392_59550 [Streptomyces clavifer]